MNLNNLIYDEIGSSVYLDGIEYKYGKNSADNFYETGSHAIYLSNKNYKYGFKFFVIKNIHYDRDKIEELHQIHLLLAKKDFAVLSHGLCMCQYENKTHYGLLVDNLRNESPSKKKPFPINEFKRFCRSVPGLKKQDKYFEMAIGKNWDIMYPELEFFVGENNILYSDSGKPLLIDIDPRWKFNYEI